MGVRGLPRWKPRFVHAVADDEAAAVPVDEGGVCGGGL